MVKAISVCCLALALFAAGFIAGSWRKKITRGLEPPAPAILHQDGSVTLERVATKPPPPLPEQEGVEARTRAAIIEIRPMETPSRIQVDVLDMKDGTERITVKGDAVTGGQDFAVLSRPIRGVEKWTLGAGVGFKNMSVMGTRNMGPLQVGGLLQRERSDPRAWDAQVIVLFRF